MTPGATTTLTYRDDESETTTGRFASHPGNVNGDSRANAADILALIDHLNGVRTVPYAGYSTDINHSGASNAIDIPALVNVLQGAGGRKPWANSAKPERLGCP